MMNVNKNNKVNSLPYGKQSITQEDIDAVTSVLKSDFLTQGQIGRASCRERV
jgi:dTDP-4-amino-4,6-dideoxygalactose transaminase